MSKVKCQRSKVFHLISIFPEALEDYLKTSLLGKAQAKKLVQFKFYNLRDFSQDKHGRVDDTPYGGGAGMVLQCQPVFDCIEKIISNYQLPTTNYQLIYFTPKGKKWTQAQARKWVKFEGDVILLCGRYEGIDQRILDYFQPMEISVGNYVLSGGELPALIFIESIARLIPGVLGNQESLSEESFSRKLQGKKEYPLYTKPEEFRGLRAPEVLLSGNHQAVAKWRRKNLVG